MIEPRPRIIDMTSAGEFVSQPRRPNWPLRLGLGAAAVATIAAGLALAAVFLWLASVLIPIALIAGLVAFAALKFQAWRLQR